MGQVFSAAKRATACPFSRHLLKYSHPEFQSVALPASREQPLTGGPACRDIAVIHDRKFIGRLEPKAIIRQPNFSAMALTSA